MLSGNACDLLPFELPRRKSSFRAGQFFRAERASSYRSCPPLGLLVQHRLRRPAHSHARSIFFFARASNLAVDVTDRLLRVHRSCALRHRDVPPRGARWAPWASPRRWRPLPTPRWRMTVEARRVLARRWRAACSHVSGEESCSHVAATLRRDQRCPEYRRTIEDARRATRLRTPSSRLRARDEALPIDPTMPALDQGAPGRSASRPRGWRHIVRTFPA